MTTNNTRTALLRECHNRPDDATPRLVYAEWLSDNAASDADHEVAELFRTWTAPSMDKAIEMSRLRGLETHVCQNIRVRMKPTGIKTCEIPDSYACVVIFIGEYVSANHALEETIALHHELKIHKSGKWLEYNGFLISEIERIKQVRSAFLKVAGAMK